MTTRRGARSAEFIVAWFAVTNTRSFEEPFKVARIESPIPTNSPLYSCCGDKSQMGDYHLQAPRDAEIETSADSRCAV